MKKLLLCTLLFAGCSPVQYDGETCAIVQGACVLGDRIEDQEFIADLVPFGAEEVFDGLTFEITPTCNGAELDEHTGLVRGSPATIAASLPVLRGYSVDVLPFHPLGEMPACNVVKK